LPQYETGNNRPTLTIGTPVSLFCCPSCGLPAEDIRRFVVDSTDGPIEYLHVCCVQLHRFTIEASAVADAIATETPLPGQVPDTLAVENSAPAVPPPHGGDGPLPPSEPSTTPDVGVAYLPPPHTTVDTLRAPRTRLAAGAFFAGGLSSGFLLSVPVVVAFAVVLGLMTVAVIATLIPMAFASRRAGRGRVASFGRRGTAAGRAASSGEGQRAA
jgi:hypothetical protein